MNYAFVLMHGWGSSGDYWQNLTPLLGENNDYFVYELGYFNNINQTSTQDLQNFIDSHQDDKIIGIGHSVGFIKLLEQNVNFDYVFGLQSFTNFLGSRPSQLIQDNFNGFVNQCIADPVLTLTQLYENSRIYEYFADYVNLEGNINAQLVVDDLKDLAIDKSHLLNKIKENYCIFATHDDQAVPTFVVKDNFPENHVNFLDVEAGHGLGILYADLVAREIFDMLEKMKI